MPRAHGVTHTGRVRENNEDCFAVDEELQLYVVADGMGGHNAGEVAARVAVDRVVAFIRATSVVSLGDPADPAPNPWPFGFEPGLSSGGNRLRTAIHHANADVFETSRSADAYAGMGTTIVAALIEEGRLSVGHVGDSRLYLLSKGRLRALTRDDSWVAAMLEHDPSADPVALRHHPMGSALTNVVGTRTGPEVHVIEEELIGGEILVLLTDGVHGVLDDRWIARFARNSDDVRATASALVEAALMRGSRDNCTAVVVRCE
ncbi:MAG: protein phosphatase 2C domain-containing protein [Acidobacteriota bacterium]